MRIHRTHASALLAVALPGAWALWWPLGVLLLVALVLLRALTGVVGGFAAAVVLYPVVAWAVLPLVGLAVWLRHRFPPGALVDTSRARLVSWISLLRDWSWRGVPWYGVRWGCESAWFRSQGVALLGGPPHNEWLHVAYRFGLGGVLALLAVAGAVGPFLAHRTTAAATLAAAIMVGAVSSPWQAFTRWLRRGREGPLFGPPMVFMLSVYVEPSGTLHLYCTNPATPQAQAQAVTALLNGATSLARQYGIPIAVAPREAA